MCNHTNIMNDCGRHFRKRNINFLYPILGEFLGKNIRNKLFSNDSDWKRLLFARILNNLL